MCWCHRFFFTHTTHTHTQFYVLTHLSLGNMMFRCLISKRNSMTDICNISSGMVFLTFVTIASLVLRKAYDSFIPSKIILNSLGKSTDIKHDKSQRIRNRLHICLVVRYVMPTWNDLFVLLVLSIFSFRATGNYIGITKQTGNRINNYSQ